MIALENDPAFPVLSILGEVDIASIDELKKSFVSLETAPILIVSLEETDFIDSSVLGALVKEYKRRNGQLIIVVPETANAYRALSLTGLATYFSTVTDRRAAFARAVMLRDVGAVSFSRHGIKTPATSLPE